jgi:hypothetical protein
MAGFAVNIEHLLKFPQIRFGAFPGYLETKFLEDLNCTMQTLEPKAEDCKKVHIQLSFFCLLISNQCIVCVIMFCFLKLSKGMGVAYTNRNNASYFDQRKTFVEIQFDL